MADLTYLRLYATPDGESHFEDVAFDLSDTGPVGVLTPTIPVTGCNLRVTPAGYDVDWHPAPRRRFILRLTGIIEATASDGETRQMGPGSIVLVEDTSGKGHLTRCIGTEEALSIYVHLPADGDLGPAT
jgi:hypothetical protein